MKLKELFPSCFVVLLLGVLMSCSKQDASPVTQQEPKDSVQQINKWILDSMLHYYLWSDQIRTYPSLAQTPEDFFAQLINDEDRFSWISNGAGIAPAKNSYEKYGFHYILIEHPASGAGNLVGIITLVAPGSPAANAGLSRGDYFTRVNGQQITAQNKDGIVTLLRQNASVKLTTALNQNGAWTENTATNVITAYYEERPVFSKKIFTKDNITTGYIFYNNFSETFDKDILDALDSMKIHHVTELILDLRYNSGGSVASAAKIATALLKAINPGMSFAHFKGNAIWGNFDQTFEKAIASSSNAYRRNFNQLNAVSLQLDRIFILSGINTASAAEMMINNLKPYTSVVHIGETTLGKDKAGVLIRDLRQPKKVFWYMQPMVFNIFNANDQGNYKTGLHPQYPVSEYAILPIKDIGNVQEPLISKALTLIYGSNQVTTETLRLQKQDVHFILPQAIKFNSLAMQAEKKVEVVVHNR